jgi:hypothetical protein
MWNRIQVHGRNSPRRLWAVAERLDIEQMLGLGAMSALLAYLDGSAAAATTSLAAWWQQRLADVAAQL